jgi:hypothetical protein
MKHTLARKIGYKAPAKVKKTTTVVKTVKKPAPAPTEPEDLTTSVVAWFRDHPYFAPGKMCADINVDRSNLHWAIKGVYKTIKPENLAKIIPVIEKYGYKRPEVVKSGKK